MTKVAVVYHSGYGHTHEQAKAVAEGAASVPGVEAELLRIEKADQDFEPILAKLDAADAIVFGSPTYMGSASAPFKAFIDATSKSYFVRQWQDKVAAGFTNSASMSGDKLNTLVQFAILAAQHGMIWVGSAIPPGNNNTKGSPDDLNRLGSYLGAMAQSPADAGPDAGPSASDKKTAAALGKRVAEAAKRWNGQTVER
jgi:NAD(P)H dehydrogenase (quinone)